MVTGAAGWVGRMLCSELVSRGYGVVGVDRRRATGLPTEVEFVLGSIGDIDLKEVFDGADAVVHAAWDPGVDGGVTGAPAENIDVVDNVIESTGIVGASQLVFISCAVVYGAWPDNPVPLSESAPVNPNTSYSFAAQKAEAEQHIRDWHVYNPNVALTILRPVVIVAGQTDSPLARVLGGHRTLREPGADHQVQFVHVEDVVSAIAHVVEKHLGGTFNVSPNNWIFEREARELVGTSSEIRVPSGWRSRLRSILFLFGRSEDAPTIDPYVENPWVVANDKLRATGWEPKYTNEEALVSWQPLTWWGRQSPARRRVLIVSSASAGAAAASAGIFAGVRALLHRSRR